MTETVLPARTLDARLAQYIDVLLKYEYDVYTIRDLGLKGAVWTTCNITLRKAGLIKIEEKRPRINRFRIVGSKEEFIKWLEARLIK